MRVVVIWALLATSVAALAAAQVTGAHLDAGAMVTLSVLTAAIIAMGVSSSAAIGALRTAKVRVVQGAQGQQLPSWGIWRGAVLPVLGAAAAAAALSLVIGKSGMQPFPPLLLSSLLAVGLARVLTRVPAQTRPLRRRRLRWLLVEGALPAAVMASVLGIVVGVVRFGALASVPPGTLARTLAGTCLTYLLLGLGGFAKAFHEHKAGVVEVEQPAVQGTPGPLMVGLLIAALVAVLGPWLLPAVNGAQVAVVKGVVGFFVGGTLSLLGALAGHRAAAALTTPT